MFRRAVQVLLVRIRELQNESEVLGVLVIRHSTHHSLMKLPLLHHYLFQEGHIQRRLGHLIRKQVQEVVVNPREHLGHRIKMRGLVQISLQFLHIRLQ